MRINSGKYRGIFLENVPGDNTRPTTQKVKEAIFSMLYGEVADTIVLDLFAGSGSLGIEALSYDAKHVTFVDNDNIAVKIIESNLHKLKDATNYDVIKSDYLTFLENTNKQYDLIFLDPPYKLEIMSEIIKLVIDQQKISDNGIIVCELALGEQVLHEYKGYSMYKDKKYGKSTIKMYRRKQ